MGAVDTMVNHGFLTILLCLKIMVIRINIVLQRNMHTTGTRRVLSVVKMHMQTFILGRNMRSTFA